MTSVVKAITWPGGFLIAGICCVISFQAHASNNFNYNHIQLQYGVAQFHNPLEVDHSQGRDAYQNLGIVAASVSYRLPNRLILGGSTTQGHNKSAFSRLQSRAHGISFGYTVGIRGQMDIYGNLGWYVSEAKACNDTQCIQQEDQAMGYDLGLRLGAKHWLEYGFNVKSIPYGKFGETTTFGGHAAAHIDRFSSLVTHAIYNQDSWAMTLGYRFSF